MTAPSSLRYSYADTDAGQLHLSITGDGPNVVLMHWTPLSARMYEHELQRLADLGFKAIGVDLMGFGRSAKPGEIWPFEKHAAIVEQALTRTDIKSFAVLGAHFSAPIAVELALSNTAEVTALMLDGCGHLLPQEAAGVIGAKVGKMSGPGLHEDGSHRTFLWDQAINAYSIFDPDFELTPGTLSQVYRFILDYLSTGMPDDFGTFSPYDMTGKLAEVTVPSCVLTAETDPLRAAQKPTVEALKAGTSAASAVTLSGGHPLHDPNRRGEYAGAIAAFLKEIT